MDWLNGHLQVETWVKLESRMLNNFTGFITEYDHEEDRYRVQLTKNASGGQTAGSLWVNEEDVTPIGVEIDERFLQGLIDTTLVINQKEWFMELTWQPAEAVKNE
jgi:outer membrane lipoprotein-sorting protein